MVLAPGARLGPYEIGALIGVGGMGEVYRATDTNLKRAVAIKVLPASVAGDADRLARFQREAEVLASLNHPNIAQIHGLEKSGGTTALVMELVEGPTLADRIALRPMPVDEALEIARQIADALEAAHERGIIHRDLKPANVKIPPDGTVKVLDFGLAKAMDPVGLSAVASQSPTITSPAMTQVGVILGTAAYMSPEQARGKAIDKRADIWAFGCVLYEMLAGKRAFGGDDVTATLARVIEREPDFDVLPSSVPERIRPALRVCLRKDPKHRASDIRDVRLAIEGAFDTSASSVAGGITTPPSMSWRGVAVNALWLAVGAVTAGAGVWIATRPSPPAVTRLMITTPPSVAFTMDGNTRDLAITRDGSRIVYVGSNGAQSVLVRRSVDNVEAIPFAGVGTMQSLATLENPFISPDGQWVGWMSNEGNFTSIRKVAMAGGPAVVVGRIRGSPRGASWSADNTIVVATSDASSGLWKISAAGGDPSPLTTPDQRAGERDHFWPEFLPDDRGVLFTIVPASGSIDNAQIAVLDLRTGNTKILLRDGSDAHHVATASGGFPPRSVTFLVYGVAGTLRAVRFDADELEVIGSPVSVLPQVATTPAGAADFAIAENGTMVYAPIRVVNTARSQGSRKLVWVDRQGNEQPIDLPARAYQYPRIAPDGQSVALSIADQQNDIWIWSLARETLTRLTFDPGLDNNPVWTPDGKRLVFVSAASGSRNLFWRSSDGTGSIERLTQSPNPQYPTGVSPGGQLVFHEDTGSSSQDVMFLDLTRGRQVRPLVGTLFNELNGEVSPDGRWFAYQSNESGQFEIFVRPFPNAEGGRWQVSTGGGITPSWTRNGEELFYATPVGELMAVPVARSGTWTGGTPKKLLEGGYYFGSATSGRTYDASLDGQRFLMIKPSSDQSQTASTSIIVVQNWLEELKRLVPTN